MTTICIEPTGATLGAIVTGVELRSMDRGGVGRDRAAFHEHAVLVFPDQHLTPAEQAAFGRRFGELSIESLVFTNCRRGRQRAPDRRPAGAPPRRQRGLAHRLVIPGRAAKASILSAHRVPSAGGATEWADMRAAYDALDPATRELVHGMSAFHSLYYSQARIGIDPSVTASANARLVGQATVQEAVVVHAPQRPLVKVHPVTGRPALFVGRHAYGIPGLDPAESSELLDRADRRSLPTAAGAQPPLAAGRHRRVGQPLRAAPGPALRPDRGPLHGAHRVNGEAATEHAAMVPAPAF